VNPAAPGPPPAGLLLVAALAVSMLRSGIVALLLLAAANRAIDRSIDCLALTAGPACLLSEAAGVVVPHATSADQRGALLGCSPLSLCSRGGRFGCVPVRCNVKRGWGLMSRAVHPRRQSGDARPKALARVVLPAAASSDAFRCGERATAPRASHGQARAGHQVLAAPVAFETRKASPGRRAAPSGPARQPCQSRGPLVTAVRGQESSFSSRACSSEHPLADTLSAGGPG